MAGDYHHVVDVPLEVQKLKDGLRWPDPETMAPYYHKLIENPGSLVFLAIENPRGPNGPTIGKGWFSVREREILRKGLQTINERRRKRGEPLTTEAPSASSKPIEG